MSEISTRQRMIETAVRLFQRQGYHATSWRNLVDEAGTPWGSAHHHFPEGKEQLGVSAIELGASLGVLQLEQVLSAHRGLGAAVRAWFRNSAEQLAESGYVNGCPIATVALETVATSPQLAAACKHAFDSWTRLLTERFERGGIKRKRAAELATLALVSFEGALVVARVTRSQAPLQLAGEQLAAAVESATAS